MVITKSLQKLYSVTIDRSKFREVASRVIVFATPLFFWGKPINLYGLLVAAVGVFIRAWAAGYLRKDQALAQGGPYSFARHPLYLGSCLLALGFIITLQNFWVLLIIGGVTALQYFHTIRHEEKNLMLRFGAEYARFKTEVGPLWPKLPGLKKWISQTRRGQVQFSLKQYFKNKEYECLLGVAVVFIFLYLGSRQ